MAKTIAKATGLDESRSKEVHRLGSRASKAEANTWRTFSEIHMNADGSGYFRLFRDGIIMKYYKWDTE